MKNKFLELSYPYLIVSIPILNLFSTNIHFVNLEDIYRPLFWILSITALLVLLLNIILKHLHKASLFSSLGIFLLLVYGHGYLGLANTPDLQRHRNIIAAVIIIFLLGGFVFTRIIKNYQEFGRTLTFVSLFWIASIFIQIGGFQWNLYQANTSVEKINDEKLQTLGSSNLDLPDIYWVILDGYTRSDVLRSDYNYDDTTMIDGLEDLGFYVAKCSQSNYPNTVYSLTSAINLNYLQDFLDNLDILPSWASSTLIRTLRNYGYQIITFKNSVRGHFDLGEDVLIQRAGKTVPGIGLFGNLTEFELLVFNTSILRVFKDGEGLFGDDFSRNASYNEHYFQTIFNIDSAQNLSNYGSPKFVLLHIIAPHDPYVFSPDGKYSNANIGNQIKGYATNVEYLGNTIPNALGNIIENSDSPPIIIIQGDHGPTGTKSADNRMKILNAFYFPDEIPYTSLYPEISPVNNFRVLLNSYFDGKYPLLDDKAYYTYGTKVSENDLITDNCNIP
jgi:hypothetical protein